MDAGKLMAATAEDFVFDDPAEAALVTWDGLPFYMERWLERAGGHNEWVLSHEVRQDENGMLTDWEWWEVVGTGLSGSAVVTTSDQGVHLERITYFRRNGQN